MTLEEYMNGDNFAVFAAEPMTGDWEQITNGVSFSYAKEYINMDYTKNNRYTIFARTELLIEEENNMKVFTANVWLLKHDDIIEWDEVDCTVDCSDNSDLKEILSEFGEVGEELHEELSKSEYADGVYRHFLVGEITYTKDYWGEVDCDIEYEVATREYTDSLNEDFSLSWIQLDVESKPGSTGTI